MKCGGRHKSFLLGDRINPFKTTLKERKRNLFTQGPKSVRCGSSWNFEVLVNSYISIQYSVKSLSEKYCTEKRQRFWAKRHRWRHKRLKKKKKKRTRDCPAVVTVFKS